MIIGSGLIANAIFAKKIDRNDVLFFAKGVSNSNETNQKEFDRERKIIIETIENNKDKLFVYFSSCGIASNELTPYFAHKLTMETIITKNCEKYLIFRLPQIVGKSSNRNTLLNFLYRSLINKNKINLWVNASRNLIDIDDAVNIINEILKSEVFSNKIVNIASPYTIKMSQLILIIEEHFNAKFIYDTSEQISEYEIDISEISKVISIEDYFLCNKKKYITKILSKYFN